MVTKITTSFQPIKNNKDNLPKYKKKTNLKETKGLLSL